MDDTSITDASMNFPGQLRKGTTKLAVLAALERGEVYGYGIRREVFHRTKGVFAINEGALYPLLHTLERRGLVRVRNEEVKGRERRYYTITAKGRRELDLACREWSHLQTSLAALLR
jgi:PadR family transcriptional regulator, regulatory protein PadR